MLEERHLLDERGRDRPHAQEFPVDLARPFAGHLGNDTHLRGNHELRKPVGDETAQCLRAGLVARLQDDVGVGSLAEGGVGHADHTGFAHGRVLQESRLDLEGSDLVSRANDQVLPPADEPEKAVFVVVAEIASIDPALPPRAATQSSAAFPSPIPHPPRPRGVTR
jgi:hypothetical protein